MQNDDEFPDTGWHIKYKPILDDVVKATDSARTRIRSLKAAVSEQDRVHAFADAHHIPDELLEQALVFTKDYITDNGTIDPPDFLAQFHDAVPKFAAIVGNKTEIYGPLIRVAGLEVFLQGIVFSTCGEYLDEEAHRPRHAADSVANHEDFLIFLHNELGVDRAVTAIQVNAYETIVRKTICAELGISETTARSARAH